MDDIGRMTKVCNHNFIPIIGYVENMSGVYMNGEIVKQNGHMVAPFGKGNIEQFANKVEGKFLGPIPLCHNYGEIEDASTNTIKNIGIRILEAERVKMPDLSEGDKGFIRNVWGGLKAAIKTVNSELDINSIQQEFGNPNEPKTIAINLTDAEDSWLLPSTVHIKVDGGLKVVKNPDSVYGGISMTSQELKFALDGQRVEMDSPKALYSKNAVGKASYGLVDAVQMGKATVEGDGVINYLSLLDKIFEDVIDESKLQKAVRQNS